MKIDYRLALDLGANSIGWCVYRLSADPSSSDEGLRWRLSGIQRMGVRIFSDGRDPKDLASLAASRRLARQQRRRRDRALKRKRRLMEDLIRFGLMPADPVTRKALVELDPFEIRKRALDEAVDPHHFGRAIFHLARKRGFRSGRKDFSTDEKEAGKIKSGIDRLRSKLQESECRTVGEFLAREHESRKPVLARPGSDGEYPIYLARELVSDEFDLLWAAQSRWHPTVLTNEARDRIRDTILFQRPLRPVLPGKCLFEPDQDRALLAHPLSQRFRILQELANLRIVYGPAESRQLTLQERDRLLKALTEEEEHLDAKKQLTWARIRSLLGLKKVEFNLDKVARTGLKADFVSIGLSKPDALGEAWKSWGVDRQNKFLQALRKVDRIAELRQKMADAGFELGQAQLPSIFASAARMPDDHGQVSLKALQRIVPQLESGVVHYDKAVLMAGYQSHSDFYDGEILTRLPYYGERLAGYVQPRDLPSASPEERRWGRIANPTVHVGLNQLRRVVNAILKRYGNPREIIIEVARELGLSGQNRRKLIREQEENRERNERLGAKLVELGQANNRLNRQRLQLFEELTKANPLDAECVYTGERISLSMLFSGDVDIDHILPFSRSLDDGVGNKLLCLRRANRDKGQMTPHEAFSASPGTYSWEGILERAKRLVPRKAKRFSEGAIEDFLQGRDFLDRHLTDTAYFSRVSKQYLISICPPNRVWVSTGKLTSMMRARWGLNRVLSESAQKDRKDHRHHAVDAAVIGACDRRLIKGLATAASRAERSGLDRLAEGIEPPWPGFFDAVRDCVGKIAVSHKPDHGVEGQLHNETVYGLVDSADQTGRYQVSRTVPLLALKKPSDLESLADQGVIRADLDAIFRSSTGASQLKEALTQYSARTGVRRVKLVERLSVIEIANPHRQQPKLVKPDSNFCCEVTREKDGRWIGRIITRFEAARANAIAGSRGLDGERLVMRLHIGDVVRAAPENVERLYRVVKLSEGRVIMAELHEAGSLKSRHENPNDPFRYWQASPNSLKAVRARTIGIDELGYCNDPGFHE